METRVKKYRQQLSPERSKVWKEKPPKGYKNGYVWHDLSEDDLILPAHGNEYVLKGSELFCESNSDRFSPISNVKLQGLKRLPEPVSCRSHDEASSSSSMNEREGRNSHEDEVSPSQHTGSSDVSPQSRDRNSDSQSLSLTEYKIYKTDGLADASTQTEEYTNRPSIQKTCTKGVSTEDSSLESECDEICETQAPQVKDNSEICPEVVSPLSNSSPLSSRGKTETLESLIRADASRMNSFRILEDEGIEMQTSTRLKASNLLLQLISCGSISVKNHSLDLIPSYKARFSHSKFPSPLFSTSVMLGELDCIGGNLKATSLRMEDREYFSGSLVESKMAKEEDGHNVLKRSSSFNAERSNKESKSQDMEEPSSGTSKCNSRSINDSGILPIPSNGNSKSITRPSSEKKYSTRLNSFREEKVIQIEES
ncbi:hypothetical protein TSUD_102820 [Trifolium subterraneum]|uniref:SOSEKI DIX-like domain-containing protein n=1 Tax=Trifolium subterraneum TaxID=3900 RepID=A0A2Z6NPE7_TRISU|nr:hypothetical protein TSUD_102820 [Trifolium subterraneum]